MKNESFVGLPYFDGTNNSGGAHSWNLNPDNTASGNVTVQATYPPKKDYTIYWLIGGIAAVYFLTRK